MQYRPEIDGLRALAVAAVIANHVSKDMTRPATLVQALSFCLAPVFNHVDRSQLFLYRDIWSHPSIEAARQMAPYFRAALGSGVEASAQQTLTAEGGNAP